MYACMLLYGLYSRLRIEMIQFISTVHFHWKLDKPDLNLTLNWLPNSKRQRLGSRLTVDTHCAQCSIWHCPLYFLKWTSQREGEWFSPLSNIGVSLKYCAIKLLIAAALKLCISCHRLIYVLFTATCLSSILFHESLFSFSPFVNNIRNTGILKKLWTLSCHAILQWFKSKKNLTPRQDSSQ